MVSLRSLKALLALRLRSLSKSALRLDCSSYTAGLASLSKPAISWCVFGETIDLNGAVEWKSKNVNAKLSDRYLKNFLGGNLHV